MTTTSRRPPPKTPKTPKAPGARTRQRPPDAAAPAKGKKDTGTKDPATKSPATKGRATKGTGSKGTGTKGTGTKGRPPGAAPKTAPAPASAPKTAPARRPAPAKDKDTTAKAPVKAPAKTAAKKAAPAKSAEAAGVRRAASRRTQAPPRTPFVLLIVGLLGGALVSLLLLNTVLAKDAFTLARLQQSTKQLEQQRQAYEAEIARESSPEELSNKARNLGMKEAEDPAFFHGGSGRASGGGIRPVPDAAAAAAGAAGVVGIPGTVVPSTGVPSTGVPGTANPSTANPSTGVPGTGNP